MTDPLPSPFSYDPHSEHTVNPFDRLTSTSEPRSEHVDSTLFLGLDLSTQALKASFANAALDIIAEFSVNFDQDLPEFGTKSGVHMSEGGVVTSPVLMWLKAIDLLFERIFNSDGGQSLLSRVCAISGAGQQHASVYWSPTASRTLASLDAERPLAEQFDHAFSSPVSPNWQDSSSTEECREMENLVGGEEEMARRTGSRAHERFTGPQILKLRRNQPEVYDKTDRISLVSSFLTTLFCADGEIKPMEESDACGTNLWDLSSGNGYDQDLLSFVAGGDEEARVELERKLGPVEKDGGVSAGTVGQWFVGRYGMRRDCQICHFTGDNPATILSFSLLTGETVVSLGTSDTVLLSTTDYAPTPDAHLFSYPANRKGGKVSYMAMLCYKNGSLPREYVRDKYAGGSWATFDKLADDIGYPSDAATRAIGFYFLKPEIIPHNGHGVHHFLADGTKVDEFEDPTFNVRAILESQFLSFRMRVSRMLAASTGLPTRIFAVGGASTNTTILNTLSTVLSAPVFKPTFSSANSCAQGGCMKAYWCWARQQPGGQDLTFEDAVRVARRRRQVQGQGRVEASAELVAVADYNAADVYEAMVDKFRLFESRVCETAQ